MPCIFTLHDSHTIPVVESVRQDNSVPLQQFQELAYNHEQ